MSSSHPILPPIQSILRDAYPVRVLQFGTGNFLRGFADWMFHKMNHTLKTDWGVVAVQTVGSSDTLLRQEGQFTVVEAGATSHGIRYRYDRVQVLQQTLHAKRDWPAVVALACSEELRVILSNTTENGIVFETEPLPENQAARTYPGKVCQLLWARFQVGGEPVIVLPCELIEQNGEELKRCVLQYARAWQLPVEFFTYVQRQAFCNTLVDRIVPGFPEAPEPHWDTMGYRDDLLTLCEAYYLWVIQAPDWVAHELPFPQAGLNVIYTQNIEPYRIRKVRILNGAHSVMAPLGLLAGLTSVRAVMKDEVFGMFVRKCLSEDITPFLAGDPAELHQYQKDVVNRFLNPAIHHELNSILLNSLSKFRVRLLPSLDAYHRAYHRVSDRLALAFAGLFLVYGPTPPAYPLNDHPGWLADFQATWQQRPPTADGLQHVVAGILAREDWWGKDLRSFPELGNRVVYFISQIEKRGVAEVVKETI